MTPGHVAYEEHLATDPFFFGAPWADLPQCWRDAWEAFAVA